MGNKQRTDAFYALADAIQNVLDGSDYPPGTIGSDFVVIVATNRIDDETHKVIHGLQMLTRDDNQAPHRTAGLIDIAGEAFELEREDGDED